MSLEPMLDHAYTETNELVGSNRVLVPFLACGDLGGYDADQNYALETIDGAYLYREPVQKPIAPAYQRVMEMAGRTVCGSSGNKVLQLGEVSRQPSELSVPQLNQASQDSDSAAKEIVQVLTYDHKTVEENMMASLEALHEIRLRLTSSP